MTVCAGAGRPRGARVRLLGGGLHAEAGGHLWGRCVGGDGSAGAWCGQM